MDAVEVLIERAREAAIAAGRLYTALLDVDDAAIAGFGADEIAFALHWTSSAAHTQLATARYLHDVIPDVFTTLCARNLDAHRAWIYFDVLRTAADAVAAQVATTVLPLAATLTATELRRKLRRALIAADPVGAGERTRRGIEGRYVGSTADTDGTASLYAIRLPAARVAAAYERIDAVARGTKTAGDDRTLDQLRADTFLDLLDGTGI